MIYIMLYVCGVLYFLTNVCVVCVHVCVEGWRERDNHSNSLVVFLELLHDLDPECACPLAVAAWECDFLQEKFRTLSSSFPQYT